MSTLVNRCQLICCRQLFSLASILVLSFSLLSIPSTVLAAASKKPILETVPELVIPFEKFQLPNGLTVIVHEDNKAPLVAVRLMYKAGFSNEVRPEEYGANYLLLKLMEKGSEHYKDNINKALEQTGSVKLNNYTTADTTVFSYTVPTVALERALWLESDRMGYMLRAITDERMEEEQQHTEHFIEQRQHEAIDAIYDRIAEQSFFAGHPYARPFAGANDHESSLRLRVLKKWFRHYFTPNNAVLVLAGDISISSAKKYASKYFGDIPAGPPLKKLTRISEFHTSEKRDTMDGQHPYPIMVKVWNAPAFGDPDLAHWRLAFDLLASGHKSRLYQRMVVKEGLARDVKFQLIERLLGSQLILIVELKDGVDLSVAETLIQEEMTTLSLKGVDNDALEQAKLNTVVKLFRMGDQVAGKADMLAMGEGYLDDPTFYRAHERSIRQTNTNDIKHILTGLLQQYGYVLYVNEKIPFTTLPTVVSRKQPDKIKGKVHFQFPKIEQFKLDNGMSVVLLKRSEGTFIEASLVFDTGFSSHTGKPGLPVLAFQHFMEGKTKSKQTLSDIIKSTAGQMSTYFNADSSMIQLSLLKAGMPKVFQTMAELFIEPQFRPELFEQEKKTAALKSRWEKTEAKHFIAHVLPELLYGSDHPYAVPWTGSPTMSSLAKINREAVTTYWKKWLRPDNATLVIAGDLTMESLKEILSDTLAAWQAPIVGREEKDYPTIREPEHAGRAFIAGFPQSTETTIIAAQLTIPAPDERTVALSLANDVIGGRRTSRLHSLFEEEKGWGVDVKSEIKSVRAEQPFIITATVPVEHTVDTIRLINNLYQSISTDEPLTNRELLWVRNNRTREMPGLFESNKMLVNRLATFIGQQLPLNLLSEYPALIAQVSDEAVIKTAKKVFAVNQLVWLILGDHKSIGAGIRSLDFKEVVVLDHTGEIPKLNKVSSSSDRQALEQSETESLPDDETSKNKTSNEIESSPSEATEKSTDAKLKKNSDDSQSFNKDKRSLPDKYKPADELNKTPETAVSDSTFFYPNRPFR